LRLEYAVFVLSVVLMGVPLLSSAEEIQAPRGRLHAGIIILRLGFGAIHHTFRSVAGCATLSLILSAILAFYVVAASVEVTSRISPDVRDAAREAKENGTAIENLLSFQESKDYGVIFNTSGVIGGGMVTILGLVLTWRAHRQLRNIAKAERIGEMYAQKSSR